MPTKYLLTIAVALFAFSVPALAQDAAAPAMTWLDFAKGVGSALLAYVKGPAVIAFLMAQARAWFPALGNLGILTVIGDVVAGNYGAAKNASN